MPFYISPTGETYYRNGSTEYSGYAGPSDLIGFGEYTTGDQFNSAGGKDTTPIPESEDIRKANTQSNVNIKDHAVPGGSGNSQDNPGHGAVADNGQSTFGTGAGPSSTTNSGAPFGAHGPADVGA